MQIQIFAQGLDVPDALRTYVERNLKDVLKHLEERLTRVEVHLKDLNSSKKNGIDKRCLIEARPRGMDPVAAEHDASEFKDAVHQATLKLERVLQHKIGKQRSH
ncbi:MAG TPA: HPF/RaiA family ribosome-associated protein [Planctomycetota bacterium]